MKLVRTYSFIIFIILIPFVLHAQEAERKRHAITFDDFIKIGRVSDPQLSPDGKMVLFVVTYSNFDENKSNSDIFSVPVTGGSTKQLTDSPKADANPRWSADGNTIAFISSREGGPQIWLMNPDGSNQRKLTSISTGASGVEWSPTGAQLIFNSEVYPDCASDDCNKQRDEEKEKSKVKARIHDKLPIRVWDHWREGKYSHLFVVDANGGTPMDVTPGEFDSPPIDLNGHPDYAISPDGKEIAFVKSTEKNLMWTTNNDIWIADIDGKNARCITKENKAVDNQPVYSPDGKYIAYRAMARPGFEADKCDLMLYDRKAKTTKKLTEGIDRSVGEVFWSGDSKQIFFTAEEAGYMSLFEVPAKGGDVLRIMKGVLEAEYEKKDKIKLGMFRTNFSQSKDGKTFVFLAQRSNYPAEIISANFEGKKTTNFRQITNVNGEILKTLDMTPAESVTYRSTDGEEIQAWIIKPSQFDSTKKYPTIFLVHGGPQGAWQDNFHYRWNYQMFAAPGNVVIAINPRGSTGFGQKYTDAVSGDWGGKPYADIIRGVDMLLKRYKFIDENRLGAAGASYGGFMINWMLGNTTRFKAFVSHAGIFNQESMYGYTEELWFPEWEFKGTPWTNPSLYARFSPLRYAKNMKTPTLVTHGELDFRVPYTEAIQLFSTLQRLGTPSKLILFPDETHFIAKPQNAKLWWNEVHGWFAKWLK